MIASIFKSFSDTFSERIRSPFGGTLIAVIILLNWKLFLGIIFFDDSFNFDTRIDYVENYLTSNYPWKLLIHPVWITFVSIFSFLILSYIAMAINLLFTKIIKPWIVKAIDKSSIVTREVFTQYQTWLRQKETEATEWEKKYLTAKAEKANLELEKQKTEQELINLNAQLTDLKMRPLNDWKETKLHREFYEEWINVYQNIDDSSENGSELFQVNAEERYISDNNNHPIYIKQVLTDRNNNLLYFEKHVRVQSQTRILANYLYKAGNNKFDGIEFQIQGHKLKRIKVTYYKNEK